MVINGDWDMPNRRFETAGVYQGFREHFVENIPWKETRHVKEKLNDKSNHNASEKNIIENTKRWANYTKTYIRMGTYPKNK